MLSYTDLKKGILFVMNNEPWEVLDSHFLRMQQRKAVVQTTIKNLITGKVINKNFQPSDTFEEAEIEKIKSRFLYAQTRQSDTIFWFDEIANPKNRFSFSKKELGEKVEFLKPNLEVSAITFNGKIIGIELPVKADYRVIEAPPIIKGNTASGGTKLVTIETGAKINVPLFIKEGDYIRINTQTREYEKRL